MMYTQVRALVRAEVADKAKAKAETDGKTLADVVNELLADYANAKPKPRGKSDG